MTNEELVRELKSITAGLRTVEEEIERAKQIAKDGIVPDVKKMPSMEHPSGRRYISREDVLAIIDKWLGGK